MDVSTPWVDPNKRVYKESELVTAWAGPSGKMVEVSSAPIWASNEPPAPLARSSFLNLLEELGELHALKNQDYGRAVDPYANVRGSAEWGVKPWVGAMVRANDKVKRLQKYAQDGKLANEGVEDSLLDLAVYSMIALILYREDTKGDSGA